MAWPCRSLNACTGLGAIFLGAGSTCSASMQNTFGMVAARCQCSCVCCLHAMNTIGRHRKARSAITNITATIAWSMCLKVHSHNSKAHWGSRESQGMGKQTAQIHVQNPRLQQQTIKQSTKQHIHDTSTPWCKTPMFPWHAYFIYSLHYYHQHHHLWPCVKCPNSSDIVQLCYSTIIMFRYHHDHNDHHHFNDNRIHMTKCSSHTALYHLAN